MASVSNSLTSSTGLDVQSTVDQLIYTERAPERLMQQRQAVLDAQAAAMRSIQSGLQDLEQKLHSLKDFTGALSARKAESTAPEVLSARAEASAASGTHTVVVQKLATTSSYYTKSITDPGFVFGPGSTFTLQVGDGEAVSVAFDGKTIQKAADSINNLDFGVRATVITDAAGSRLALVSNTSGLPGAIKISNDQTGLAWQTSNPGQNAEVLVDGVPVQSATNTVSGVIPGLTLTLARESAGPVQVTVGPDTARAKQALTDFVNSYNSVISAINAQYKVNPSTNVAGVLAGDSTIRGLQATLLSSTSYVAEANTGAETLRSIGVEMQNDGTLKINETTLDHVIATNFTSFQNFFQGTTPEGFARTFASTLMKINDSVLGSVALDLKGIQATRDSIGNQIDNFEVRIKMRQQQLFQQYSQIDVMLRKLPSLQSQISAQLGSLNSK